MVEFFEPGQYVEAFGLSSAAGSLLNGRRGVVFRHIKVTDRVEVRFPNEQKARSLHAERLRLVKEGSPPEDLPQDYIEAAAGIPASLPSAQEAAKDSSQPQSVEAAQPGKNGKNAEAKPVKAKRQDDLKAKARKLEDLKVGDNLEAFGMSEYQAEWNGKTGVITAIKPKGIGRGVVDPCAIFDIKFSEFYIDDNGDPAEKGQVLSLLRAKCRLPGTGPPGEVHEKPPGKPGEKASGFSKAKRSQSRSRSRARRKGFSKAKRSQSRSRSRSRSKSRRRGRSRSRGRKRR